MEIGNNKHKNGGGGGYQPVQHIFLVYKNKQQNETGEKIKTQTTSNKREIILTSN